VLVPALTFIVTLLALRSTHEQAENDRRLAYRARAVGELVDGEVLAVQRTLDALASSTALDDPPDLAAFHVTARRIRDTQPAWVEVILFDAGGTSSPTPRSTPTPAATSASVRCARVRPSRSASPTTASASARRCSRACSTPSRRRGRRSTARPAASASASRS